jgi:aspartate--ammonia ligase
MGVRVDAAALARQLAARNCPERSRLPFHRSLLEGRLPESIGGGIGQARLCMALLGARAIGEVRPFAERADSILPEAARACPAR